MKAKTLLLLALSAALATGIVNQAKAEDESAIDAEREKQIAEIKIDFGLNDAISTLVFIKSKPQAVFEYVRQTIIDVMDVYTEKGFYIGLDQAYAIAVYLHYDVTADNYKWFGLRSEDFDKVKDYPRPPRHSYFPPREKLFEI